jgi:uncharacterized protein involved in exopolysaccharide biosynthesis
MATGTKLKMIGIFLVLMTIVVIKVFGFPVYEAESVLMVDIKNRATSPDSEKIDLSNYLGYIRNNEELLKSEPMLRKVVEGLKLYEDFPAKPWGHVDTETMTDLEKEKLIRTAIEYLQKKGIITSSPPFTNLIIVQSKYKDPIKSADIVNLLIKTYVQWNIGFIHTETDNVIAYLNEEVEKAKDQLSKSEDSLRQFKSENNIIDLPEEVRTYLQMIPEEFKIQYQYDQANRLKLLEMKNSLNLEAKNSVYQLMQYTQANQLKALEVTNALNLETNHSLYEIMHTTMNKLLDLQVELMKLKELYTDDSPQIKYMNENIKELKEKLNKISLQAQQQDQTNKKQIEQETVKFQDQLQDISVKAQVQDQLSQKQIEQEANKFKDYSQNFQINEKYLEHFKGLPEKEMMLLRLEREVKINEMAYTFLVQEQEKANLVKAKQTTENIKVVSAARVPLKPKGRITGLMIGFIISVICSVATPLVWKHRATLFP